MPNASPAPDSWKRTGGFRPGDLRAEARFYPECAERRLAPVFARYADPRERVVVVTDRLPLKRTKQAVEKTFKLFIRRRLGAR